MSLAVLGDGNTVAVGDPDSDSDSVSLWDIRNPAAPTRHPTPIAVDASAGSAQRDVAALAAVGESTLAVAGTDGWVGLFQVTESGQPVLLGEISGDGRSTTDVSLVVTGSADKRTLALGRSTVAVTLGDITDPHQPARLRNGIPGSTGMVAFAQDGHTLAIAGDFVLLWDVSDPNRLRQIQLGPALQDGTEVVALAFGGDGQTLATATGEGATRLWDLRDLQRVRADAATTACAIARGGLTPEEWTRYVSGLAYVDSCAG